MADHEFAGSPDDRSIPGLVPRPDPTVLTTEALNREVSYLRTLLEAQVKNANEMTSALRRADEKFESERDRRITEVALERDRRLTEVATEREKALKIKEEADKEALRLDREIRQYKDIATGARQDAATQSIEQRLVPLDRYVAGQQGGQDASASHRQGSLVSSNWAAVGVAAIAILITILIAALATHGFTK